MGDKMDDKLKELILDNQNLIYSIIHKYRSKDLEDLFQVGCIGLIKAYQNFDSTKDVKFTSYAYNYIVGEIYQYIINNRNIHLSPVNVKLYNKIIKVEEYLTNHLGRIPTINEICAFLEIEPSKYSDLKNIMSVEDIDTIYNIGFKENVSKDDLIDLKDALSLLTNEEKKLINARYFNNYTQTELARIYHTNQVKISREEKKILSKLKAKIH